MLTIFLVVNGEGDDVNGVAMCHEVLGCYLEPLGKELDVTEVKLLHAMFVSPMVGVFAHVE